MGVHRSRVVMFAAIRLRGPGFKPRPGQKFETRFLLHSHPSGGEGVSPVQGEAIRCRYIKPEYLSYPIVLFTFLSFCRANFSFASTGQWHYINHLTTVIFTIILSFKLMTNNIIPVLKLGQT